MQALVICLLALSSQAAVRVPAPPGPATAGVQPAPTPGPVSVTAKAGVEEIGVGEMFTLEIQASGPPGATYEFVREVEHESFELRQQAPPSPEAAAPPLPPNVFRYDAAVFGLSTVQIPAIPVRYRLPDGTTGEASSAPLELKVVSRLAKDPEQQKLADIRGPAPVAIGTAFWIALGIVLAALAGLTWWLLRRRRRARPTVPALQTPAMPPDLEARLALDALAASALLAQGEYRGFYIRLTAIAKRYLERRLQAPVLEMTTVETLAFLRSHPHGTDLVGVVREVAESADRIKFARGEGLLEEAERHLGNVRRLVGTVEARLAPAAPAKERSA